MHSRIDGAGARVSAVRTPHRLGRAAQRNIEVIRRRSGGGIVLVDPHRSLWIDIEIGADDSRYVAEPLGMMAQVGRWWLAALVSLDCAFPGIWQFVGQTGSDSDGELVCFAGRSHGELMVEQSKLGSEPKENEGRCSGSGSVAFC